MDLDDGTVFLAEAFARLGDGRGGVLTPRLLSVCDGLDNFGTGSSALATLTTLEIDYVKLDGTFLATAATGRVGMSVNKAVVDLARALGLAVVGQGGETPHHLELLKALGCTLGHGFGLASLMALAEVPQQALTLRPSE